jgi:hypothetical protein
MKNIGSVVVGSVVVVFLVLLLTGTNNRCNRCGMSECRCRRCRRCGNGRSNCRCNCEGFAANGANVVSDGEGGLQIIESGPLSVEGIGAGPPEKYVYAPSDDSTYGLTNTNEGFEQDDAGDDAIRLIPISIYGR